MSGQAPVELRSTDRQPVRVEITADGLAEVSLPMQGSGDDYLSLDGRIRNNKPSKQMHVAVLLANGTYVDTDAGNQCIVAMATLSEKGLTGSAICRGFQGQTEVRVRIDFVATD